MGQKVTIEPMRVEDIPEVMRVEAQSFPLPWSRHAYLSELSNRSAAYYVARLDNKIIGYTGMWVIMDEAHVTTIAVDPVYRRKKIGEQLLITLIDEAMVRGARRMTLEVRKSNYNAQALYTKYGFYSVGFRKGYYTDNHEDAAIMWTDDMFSSKFRENYQKCKESLKQSLDETVSHTEGQFAVSE